MIRGDQLVRLGKLGYLYLFVWVEFVVQPSSLWHHPTGEVFEGGTGRLLRGKYTGERGEGEKGWTKECERVGGLMREGHHPTGEVFKGGTEDIHSTV